MSQYLSQDNVYTARRLFRINLLSWFEWQDLVKTLKVHLLLDARGHNPYREQLPEASC